MHGKKTLKNFVLILLSGGIFLGNIYTPIAMAEVNIVEKQSSKAELQKRKKELAKELNSASTEVQKEAKNKAALDKKIQVVQSQIDTSNKYINNLENKIFNLQKQITEITEKKEQKIDALREILREVYKAGDTYTLDILLGSKDFLDFLDKADMTQWATRAIQKLIDGLNKDLSDIEKKQQAITADKKKQEQEKTELEKTRTEHQVLLDESEKLLFEHQEEEKEAKRELDQNAAEIKAIDDQIKKYYEEQKRKQEEEARRRAAEGKPPLSDKPVHKGTFLWPVPGFYKITSGFSDTEHRAHVHGAVDIAGRGVYGAAVVASASGTVILANTDGYGGGYGNYIVIDHGNGVSTLYAHLSSVSVSVDKQITAGQVIGNVGNTGFSTGPHLHFEYRVNGIRRNPREILSY